MFYSRAICNITSTTKNCLYNFLQNTLESFHVLASPEYILVCSTCPEFLSGILPEISICSYLTILDPRDWFELLSRSKETSNRISTLLKMSY